MDYRGTGATSDPGGDLSTSLLADDAIAVLDHLGVERAHVYGTAMGGRIAQHLAGRNPDRDTTLALACTSPGGPHAAERDTDVRKALLTQPRSHDSGRWLNCSTPRPGATTPPSPTCSATRP